MADELLNLSQIFDGSLFRIPDYQRGYAWQAGKRDQKSQLGEFWDDLVNLADDKNHYTGLLTLNELPADEAEKILDEDSKGINARVYEVVDGQQRLTTAIILITVLLERFRTDKVNFEEKLDIEDLADITKKFIRIKRPKKGGVFSYVFGYAKDDPSYNCLRYKIFGEEKDPAMGATPDTYYTKNLEDAKKFFKANVAKLNDDDAVKIYKKLINKLKFNIHKIGNDFDVFVSFETMNNRGKPLSNLELLKNRLIYLSVLFGDEYLRRDITDAWKEIYKRLGQNKDELVDDDEFLRAHWITYFGAPNKKQREDISFLMKHFSPRNIKGYTSSDAAAPKDQITAAHVKQYVDSLSTFAKYYVFTHFPNIDDGFNNLNAEEKILVLFLNRLGIRYFRPLIMVACAKSSSPERLTLFKSIEQFIFVNFILRHYRSDKNQTTYYNFARELKDGKITCAAIIKSLNDSVADEIGGACKNFEYEIDENFRRGKGFFDWEPLRYVLLVREYELRRKSKHVDQLTFSTIESFLDNYNSIEHIFPQNSTYWDNVFKFSPAQKFFLQNTLGNLLLLPKPLNSSLKNAPFDEKKSRGYVNGSQSEIEVAKNSQWTAAEIFDRSQTLVDFINTQWDLHLSDAQKKSLIHLDLVK